MARVPKMAVKNIPTVNLPTESGGEETMYIFKDPAEGQRRLLVTVEVGAKKARFDMPSFTHSGQSASVANWVMSQWLENSGGGKVIDGGACLQEWEDFANKKLRKREDERGDGELPAGSKECVNLLDDDDAGELVGAAAASFAMAPPAAASSKPNGPSPSKPDCPMQVWDTPLARKKSMSSIGSASVASGSVCGDERVGGGASAAGEPVSESTTPADGQLGSYRNVPNSEHVSLSEAEGLSLLSSSCNSTNSLGLCRSTVHCPWSKSSTQVLPLNPSSQEEALPPCAFGCKTL